MWNSGCRGGKNSKWKGEAGEGVGSVGAAIVIRCCVGDIVLINDRML